jgi:hypothetical protein
VTVDDLPSAVFGDLDVVGDHVDLGSVLDTDEVLEDAGDDRLS